MINFIDLDDYGPCEVVQMFDADGDECDDMEHACAAVVRLAGCDDGAYMSVQLDGFTLETVH